LGKTWLAAFDVRAAGKTLERRPRVLIVAHRAEILVQAKRTLRRALDDKQSKQKFSVFHLFDAFLFAKKLAIHTHDRNRVLVDDMRFRHGCRPDVILVLVH